MARILIVDDHKDTRQRVRHLIEENAEWQVCGEAENGEDAVEKTGALRPDLIVMDLSMPKMNGLEAARVIHAADPEMRMVLFSINADEPTLGPQFADAGFRGVVSKDEAALLPDAIRHVLAGGVFFMREGFMGKGAQGDRKSSEANKTTSSKPEQAGKTEQPGKTEETSKPSKAAAACASSGGAGASEAFSSPTGGDDAAEVEAEPEPSEVEAEAEPSDGKSEVEPEEDSSEQT